MTQMDTRHPRAFKDIGRIEHALGGGFIVLIGGLQWGPPGSPRDAAGCAETVFGTVADARAALVAEGYRGF